MYCKRCGHALPSEGYICHNCGAMMSKEQIDMQNKYRNEQKKNKEVTLLSDKYNLGIKRDYEKRKENKFLGALFIAAIMIILVIIAIIKVM